MRKHVHRKGESGRNAVRHARKSERVKMPVTRGDTVRVMRGEDKTKEGKVIRGESVQRGGLAVRSPRLGCLETESA